MRPLALVMVAFLGLGCTTASRPAEEPAPVVVPPLPRASASAELGLETQTQPMPPPLPLPRHPAGEEQQPTTAAPGIGAACKDPTSCGKSGKVAVEYSNGHFPRNGPCKPFTTGGRNTGQMTGACVEGDRVFVTVTCVMCRMPSGEQLTGLVADMTPAQLVRAQKLAGLPEAPLLTTTKAWSEAIATAAKKA